MGLLGDMFGAALSGAQNLNDRMEEYQELAERMNDSQLCRKIKNRSESGWKMQILIAEAKSRGLTQRDIMNS